MEKTLETAPVPEQSPELKVSYASIDSEREPRRPNQDALLADTEHGVFSVFDGVGGQAAGETAARLAAATVQENLKVSPSSQESAEKLARDALQEASAVVLRKGEADPRLTGMAATASVVKLWQTPEGERRATIGNVGDSRVYVYRGRILRQLTLDDNLFLATEARTRGEARILQERLNQISNEADALKMGFADRTHYYRRTATITQALGSERLQFKPHVETIAIQPGDRLLITSDGIHDNLTTAEMLGVLSASPTAEALMRAAQTRSRQAEHIRHKKDDMTAVLVEIPA